MKKIHASTVEKFIIIMFMISTSIFLLLPVSEARQRGYLLLNGGGEYEESQGGIDNWCFSHPNAAGCGGDSEPDPPDPNEPDEPDDSDSPSDPDEPLPPDPGPDPSPCDPDCNWDSESKCAESTGDGCGGTCTRNTDGDYCGSDGDPCTEDVCSSGTCTHRDICPPNTTINPGGASWTNKNIEYELECDDSKTGSSGCERIYYNVYNNSKYDSCPSSGYSSESVSGTTATITKEVQCLANEVCEKNVCFYSEDSAGNTEDVTESSEFEIDKIKPSVECDECWEKQEGQVVFDPNVTDIGSGVKSVKVCMDKNCVKELCSSTTSTKCIYEYDKCSTKSTDFWFQGEDGAKNIETLEGSTLDQKASEGCSCSYDGECAGGSCVSGKCLGNDSPNIYFN